MAGEVRDEQRKQENEPSAVLRRGVGMVQPIPTLGLDLTPPRLVSLVAGHDDVIDVHIRVLE